MPRFGEAHKLLSATHPDTQAPAAGADPDDGQVATWSAALKAWIAQDPAAGGVTDHGLLEGLADDDHPQYGALAQGETVSGEWFLAALKATTIKDAGGNARLQLAASAPHVQVEGALKVNPVAGTLPWLDLLPITPVSMESALQSVLRVGGVVGATYPGAEIRGLEFAPMLAYDSVADKLKEISVISAIAQNPARNLLEWVSLSIQGAVMMMGATVTDRAGVWTRQIGHANMANVCAYRADEILYGTQRHYAWWGGAIPNFRVDVATPGANQTPLFLAVGATPTAMRMEVKDGAAIGAGDNVCIMAP